MKLVVKVLIGVILFLGISLVNFLASSDALYVVSPVTNDFFKKSKVVWLTVIGIIYIGYQLWLLKPNIATKREIEKLRTWIEDLQLMYALQTYYRLLETEELQAPSSIRINVMLKWRRFWFMPPRLQIVYQGCLRSGKKDFGNMGCYSDKEKRWLWKRGGTCGQAWKNKEVVFFDSKDSRFSAPQETLREGAKEITDGVASVLSIPIWSRRQDKVIGVLNVDSQDNIDKTHFDDVQFTRRFSVIRFLKTIAENLAIVLHPFADGFHN